jgi:hypothetical protein
MAIWTPRRGEAIPPNTFPAQEVFNNINPRVNAIKERIEREFGGHVNVILVGLAIALGIATPTRRLILYDTTSLAARCRSLAAGLTASVSRP